MRTVVLILMIALLPLRVWADDGMSVRMAHEQVSAAQQLATPMPEDCPMMAGQMPGTGAPDESPGPHCATCHGFVAAVFLPAPALQHGPVPSGPPVSGVSLYLSAELAPDLRPPIA